MSTVDPDIWLASLISGVVGVGGGQGIAALLRLRSDKRIAESNQELSEDEAVSQRLLALIDKQAEAIVKPLEERLAKAEGEIERLKGQIAEKDAAYEVLKRRYWRGIHHVREVRHWIRQNHPGSEQLLPQPHPSIADDI